MRRATAAIVLLMSLPSIVGAQISNGGFESTSGWTLTGDAMIASAGGVTGGYAFVGLGTGTASGAITQTFNCAGTGNVCEVRFMYRILHSASGSALLNVRIDGQTVAGISGAGPWTPAVVTTTCGLHRLSFDITVTSGTVCLDDVSAACVPGVPARTTTWGNIKSLFGAAGR